MTVRCWFTRLLFCSMFVLLLYSSAALSAVPTANAQELTIDTQVFFCFVGSSTTASNV
jgi:hypothetical protein